MSTLPAASPILEGRLYQGNPFGFLYLSPLPDLHIACPAEFPPEPDSAGEVVFFPLQDDPTIDWSKRPLWCRQVTTVARKVANAIRAGQVVLVTCAAGLNRSGLISALALCGLGLSPTKAIARVRLCRPGALFNIQFVKTVKVLGPTI